MDFKQSFQKYINKIKMFWGSLKSHEYTEKAKSLWATGRIQKSSRISYDVIWSVLLFFIIIAVVGGFFAGGVGAGYFASLVKDEPIRNYESMETDIYNYEETSSLYFAGENYIGDIRSDIYREEISLKNVSDVLKDAVIATEDEYFKDHKGIVPKAIVRAMVQQATNSATQSGGSTLTQQLVKNQILTNEVSFERKAKEILIAMRLERFFEKDEILEAYLNIVPYGRDASGGNIAGIQTAAQGIFGIDASEANLAQAAYLAGLPQSPSTYTPFKNSGGLKKKEALKPGINRMHSVLERMYESKYISKEQFDKAMAYDITDDFVEESQSPIDKYPYLTFEAEERASDIIMEQLAEEDGYSIDDLNNDDGLKEEYRTLAERALRQNGYEIHTTVDKEIHDKFKEVVQNYKYYGPDWTGYTEDPETGEQTKVTQPIQTGGILMENATGRIIGFVGGREFNKENQLNYATKAVRSNGSTMKPILVYAPAFEKGVVQPGTPVPDVPTTYGSWTPGNYGGGYHGLVSARKALTNSYNVPTIDIYNQINEQDPVSEFLKPMGITTIDKSEHANLSLSIGATTNGVTVEENVNAFATLGNNGQFADGYLIEQIKDQDGNVIYEHETEPVDVFSPETAYLTLDIMRDVINQGTGTYLKSQIKHGNVDWTGKTGTSQDYKDAWFVGVNPNVSMGVWLGYDEGKSIQCPSCSLSYSQRTQKLWAELTNAASDIKPDLVAPEKNFDRPDGIVSRSYCATSGKLPSELCQEAGLVKTDLFNAKYLPTERDDSLIRGGSTVTVNGQTVAAGSKTPEEFIEGKGLSFNPEFLERNGYDRFSDLSVLFPRTNRDAWEKIGLPESGATSGNIEDDGKNPAAPENVSSSGNTLSWDSSGSTDTVGYRIYSASSPDGSFSRVGSTTETSFTAPGNNAVYHVRAVDYFGLESSASEEVVVGEPSGAEDDSEGDDDSSSEGSESNDNSDSNDNNGNSDENTNKEENKNNNEKTNDSGNDNSDSDENESSSDNPNTNQSGANNSSDNGSNNDDDNNTDGDSTD